jgi:hypothetical protein
MRRPLRSCPAPASLYRPSALSFLENRDIGIFLAFNPMSRDLWISPIFPAIASGEHARDMAYCVMEVNQVRDNCGL